MKAVNILAKAATKRSVLLTIFLMAVSSLMVYGYDAWHYRRKENSMQERITALEKEIKEMPISIAAKQATDIEKNWKVFSSDKISYEYPQSAVLVDEVNGSFLYREKVYYVKVVPAAGYATISEWIQTGAMGTSTKLDQYEAISVDGHPGYSLKTHLFTAFKSGANIFVIMASKEGVLAPNEVDPTYAHLIESAKPAK